MGNYKNIERDGIEKKTVVHLEDWISPVYIVYEKVNCVIIYLHYDFKCSRNCDIIKYIGRWLLLLQLKQTSWDVSR